MFVGDLLCRVLEAGGQRVAPRVLLQRRRRSSSSGATPAIALRPTSPSRTTAITARGRRLPSASALANVVRAYQRERIGLARRADQPANSVTGGTSRPAPWRRRVQRLVTGRRMTSRNEDHLGGAERTTRRPHGDGATAIVRLLLAELQCGSRSPVGRPRGEEPARAVDPISWSSSSSV